MKKNIIIVGPYFPGKLYGGPVKSLLNMIEKLSDNYNFDVITNDRDLNANEPYKEVKIGQWNKVGNANVFYIPKDQDIKCIRSIFKNNKYDLIYLSSFFAKKSLLVQVFKALKCIKAPIIVAPRGEFSLGALNLKSRKKRIILFIYKLLNLEKKINYTCTSNDDKEDILSVLGDKINISVAGNIVKDDLKVNKINTKEIGKLKIVTISRVAEIKNLDYTLKVLEEIAKRNTNFEEIIFDIYGPIEDKGYWNYCLKIIENVCDKIKINYKGLIDYNQVVNVLSNYHLFILPSKGENFGHVIQEAFLAGCPVIISDKTPWKNLKAIDVGYDISLDRQDLFIKAIEDFLYMNHDAYKTLSKNAREYGRYKVDNQIAIEEHINMFEQAMKG